MRKIREVLRLKAEGLSKRRIAASLGINATAAMECLQRARLAGLSWPLQDGLDDVVAASLSASNIDEGATAAIAHHRAWRGANSVKLSARRGGYRQVADVCTWRACGSQGRRPARPTQTASQRQPLA